MKFFSLHNVKQYVNIILVSQLNLNFAARLNLKVKYKFISCSNIPTQLFLHTDVFITNRWIIIYAQDQSNYIQVPL